MSQVLFIGSSHVSSLGLAYEEFKTQIAPRCRFFCARGADLSYTKVENGLIRPCKSAVVDVPSLNFFTPELKERGAKIYITDKTTMGNVSQQFVNTGGSTEIDVADAKAIFYVVSVSPYDFKRLGEFTPSTSRSFRRGVLKRLLCDHFLLRGHVHAIRRYRPQCKHYLIGAPLWAWGSKSPDLGPKNREIVARCRRIVRSMVRDFLFDDVFMPPEDMLHPTLLFTKPEFAEGGAQESMHYQRDFAIERDDRRHMNRSYGASVFRSFVRPIVDAL